MAEWPLETWTETPQRYWYRRCDMCKRRRWFGWLYECYPPVGSKFGWWFACIDCLSVTDEWLTAFERELERKWAEAHG